MCSVVYAHMLKFLATTDISGRALHFRLTCLTIYYVGATWVWSYLNPITKGTNLCSSPCGITQMQYYAVL